MPDTKYEKAVEHAKGYYQKARKLSLIVAGIFFLAFAYFTFGDARFYLGSTVADATVTGFSTEMNRSSQGVRTVSVRANVEFLDSSGTPQTGKIGTVNGFVFEGKVGQKLQVRYNPDMRKYVKVNQFIPFWMRSIFTFGLIIIALGFSHLFAKMRPTQTIINYYLKKM